VPASLERGREMGCHKHERMPVRPTDLEIGRKSGNWRIFGGCLVLVVLMWFVGLPLARAIAKKVVAEQKTRQIAAQRRKLVWDARCKAHQMNYDFPQKRRFSHESVQSRYYDRIIRKFLEKPVGSEIGDWTDAELRKFIAFATKHEKQFKKQPEGGTTK